MICQKPAYLFIFKYISAWLYKRLLVYKNQYYKTCKLYDCASLKFHEQRTHDQLLLCFLPHALVNDRAELYLNYMYNVH